MELHEGKCVYFNLCGSSLFARCLCCSTFLLDCSNLVNNTTANATSTVPGSSAADGHTGANNGLLGTKRDSFVALSGNFGTVLAGYVSTPYRSIVTGFDVVPGSAGAGNSNGVFGKATGDVNLTFRTNAIAYASPSFNGFSGVIAYVPNSAKSVDGAANDVGPYGWNLALNYANGGLKLAYSYLKLEDIGIGGFSDENHRAHLLAASYDFGQGTTLVGMYQNWKGELPAGDDLKRNSYYLGLKHVLGANEFAVSYQKAGKLDVGGSINDTDAIQWPLRYGYTFSKRTQVYAPYTRIDNKDAANFNFGGEAAVAGAATGSNPQVLGVGIRHSF